MVFPVLRTTDPSACLASLPVSMVMVLPSAEGVKHDINNEKRQFKNCLFSLSAEFIS